MTINGHISFTFVNALTTEVGVFVMRLGKCCPELLALLM
jgi:hypothetical protein